MSNIKPIQINPELFKISNHTVKNKTLKKNSKIKSNVLKKDLLARIKSHRANKNNNLEIDNTNTPTDNNINETNNTIVEKNEIKKQDFRHSYNIRKY